MGGWALQGIAEIGTQTDAWIDTSICAVCSCIVYIHTSRCSGGCQLSSMVVRGSALLIYGQDFKVITCGYTEPSEGVATTCDCGHSLFTPLHHKPSDSISVIDPIWCRVPPGESDGGRIAACNS